MPKGVGEELAAGPGEVEVKPVRGPRKAQEGGRNLQVSQSGFEAFALPVLDELVFLSVDEECRARCGSGEKKRRAGLILVGNLLRAAAKIVFKKRQRLEDGAGLRGLPSQKQVAWRIKGDQPFWRVFRHCVSQYACDLPAS